MDASQYPITFPYGATTTPYSPTRPHTGEDRSMPIGVRLVVNGELIGLTGNTGKSTGAHLHVQKVVGNQVVHPQGGGFTIPSPAVVYETGENLKIGKYIRIQDAQGDKWSYFHLSEINVEKGHVLNMPTISQEEYDDLLKWKAIGIDAQPYKDAVVNSQAWATDMQSSVNNVLPVINDLYAHKHTKTKFVPVNEQPCKKG